MHNTHQKSRSITKVNNATKVELVSRRKGVYTIQVKEPNGRIVKRKTVAVSPKKATGSTALHTAYSKMYTQEIRDTARATAILAKYKK